LLAFFSGNQLNLNLKFAVPGAFP